MDDDKTRQRIAEAVEEYLDKEGEFLAEKLKATGQINKRWKEVRDKIRLRVGKLDITKEAFDDAIKAHRHDRHTKSVFTRIDDGEDLGLVGGFSRVLLATGILFKPVYGEEDRARMEKLAEESMIPEDEYEEGGEVVRFEAAE